GDRHDEPEIAAHQLVERFGIAHPDQLGEAHFLFLRNQRVATDLPQVLIEGPLIRRGPPPARRDLHRTHANSASGISCTRPLPPARRDLARRHPHSASGIPCPRPLPPSGIRVSPNLSFRYGTAQP